MPTAAINFIMIANGANEEFNIGDVIKHCDRSFVFQNMRKHSTQIGHIFETSKMWKNVPNLCRMPNFMYPICVECLHIPMCKHSTQIGYTQCTQSV